MRTSIFAPATLLAVLSLITFAANALAQGDKPKDGLHQTHHPKYGYLMKEENYQGGLLDGVSRYFDMFGNVAEELSFKEGVLNGPSRKFDKSGSVTQEATYENGNLQGFKRHYENGKVTGETFYRDGLAEGPAWLKLKDYEFRGQYLKNKREGKWVERRPQNWEFVKNYKDGLADGLWERKALDGNEVLRITFKKGQLASKPGELEPFPFLRRLQSLQADGMPPDPFADAAMKLMHAYSDFEYPQTPLKETIEDLRERFGTPMYVDNQALEAAGISSSAPTTINEKGHNVFFLLHDLAKVNGLTFDYRYHALWITTPKSAEKWKDATGVADLRPAKGSPLEKALGEPAKFDFLATPISDVSPILKKEHGLSVIAAGVPRERPRHKMRASKFEQSLPLRDALGIMLYMNDCRCREKDSALIIEPLVQLQ